MQYAEDELVELKVNKLTSVKTQVPYDYYTLKFCPPPKIEEKVENLGEILAGDLIKNSPYEIRVLRNETCKELCKKDLKVRDKQNFKNMIDDEYLVNWIVDNMPGATRIGQYGVRSDNDAIYMDGFPVGLKGQLNPGDPISYYVHNHVKLILKYHKEPSEFEGYRIVGFEVEPRNLPNERMGCYYGVQAPREPLDLLDEITYTYDVRWDESSTRWATRWDAYLMMAGGQIHWFAILNSVMIVVFLSGMVATILLRTLYRDIAKYNEVVSTEEQAEETGWKLVHGDVFRPPSQSLMFCVALGSGMQLFGMAVVTLVFALFGTLSPNHRGSLLQVMMLIYTIMGSLAGYTTARFCKLINPDQWKLATLLTACVFPGFIFVVFFVLNLMIWGEKSSGAVPFVTLFTILVLWFGISVPLVFLGSYCGFRHPTMELPVRLNKVARKIPDQPWYMNTRFISLLGGTLPFGAVFTELFFIMSSIWQHQFYYLFGFLALVLLILVVMCAEVSITLTYFHLAAENYHWWWRSFWASGTSGLYVFLYSITYFTSRLQIEKPISMMLYFGYMFIISTMFSLLTGSIGALSSFFFVKTIYGSIKID